MNREDWLAKWKGYGHDQEGSRVQTRKSKKVRKPTPVVIRTDECPQCSRVMTPGAVRCSRCTTIRLNAEAAF